MNTTQFLTLLVMIVFYGSYIVKTMLLKKKGISTNRLGKGDKPAYTRLLEIFLIIVTLCMVVLQLLSVFDVLPVSFYIGKYNGIIGIAVAFIGVIFFIMALIAMKSSWRAGIDNTQNTRLRTGGVLKLSRNPAFLGFDLFYIGVAYANPNILLFIMVFVSLVLFHLQILEEEKYLSTTFGDSYIRYKQKVRRYI